MFVIANQVTGMYADLDCTGEHNVRPTANKKDMLFIEDSREAWEISQNFGPDWYVMDLSSDLSWPPF